MRVLAGLVGLLVVGTAHATVIEKLALDGLVADAEAIVVGRVLDRTSHFEGRRILTHVRIETEAVLKGSPPAIVTIEVLGGEVDGIAQKVSGMAAFEPGEQVAVFLERQGAHFQTVGLAQGKLRIEADLRGVRLVRSFEGLTLVERDAAGTLVPATTVLPTDQPLSSFLVDLAAVLQPKTP